MQIDRIKEAEFSEIHFRKRKSLYIDPKICSGCKTCEIICSLTHEGVIDPNRSRIYVKSDFFKGIFNHLFCRQCSEVHCYYACPESAIQIGGRYHTVSINQSKCTGCRACEEACPFGGIRFDEDRQKAFMCDLCDGEPNCKEWCPMNAIGIINLGSK